MVGVVEQVLVYPVKSAGGRSVPQAHVDADGLRGDRVHAVVDAVTGEPVRARTAPRLHEVAATGDVDADTAALSAVLGRPVRLAAPDAGPQGAAVHLVSRRAVELAATGEVPAGCSAEDPRANLVLTLHAADDERTWVGRELQVGEAVLRLTRLPKHCLGVYADVLRPGAVAVGDPVSLTGAEPARR
ncbi:sulfurase [Blastococcus sp. TF02A-26]|nr:sulfurase [Blastococcus sp. TF02A-26]